MSTRLSAIHPYPAMIADPLAEELCDTFVSPGMRMLDPFCGTGRTLFAAASKGANCIGIDVNPLAFLLVDAKSNLYKLSEVHSLIREIEHTTWPKGKSRDIDFRLERKVEWFSEKSKKELTDLIMLINGKKRSKAISLLFGAALSATVRDVSFCRNNRWKLHRIPVKKRLEDSPSAIKIILQRLNYVLKEIEKNPYLEGNCRVINGDSRNLRQLLQLENEAEPFDVIISSPPYGDSYTTVQYGGISSICLGIVSNIRGLKYLKKTGREIDKDCLGGRISLDSGYIDSSHQRLSNYWRGSRKNESALRVYQYLSDIERVCLQINRVMRSNGRALFVVSRRRVGNWRLYLDIFLEDVFKSQGFRIQEKKTRKIKKKLLPRQVQRFARSRDAYNTKNNKVLTMSEEYIIVFKK